MKKLILTPILFALAACPAHSMWNTLGTRLVRGFKTTSLSLPRYIPASNVRPMGVKPLQLTAMQPAKSTVQSNVLLRARNPKIIPTITQTPVSNLALATVKSQPSRKYFKTFCKAALMAQTGGFIGMATIDPKKHPKAYAVAESSFLPFLLITAGTLGGIGSIMEEVDYRYGLNTKKTAEEAIKSTAKLATYMATGSKVLFNDAKRYVSQLSKHDPKIFKSDFTCTNIDRCLHHGGMRTGFIQFAAKNITTNDPKTIETIGHLLKRYPEARERLMKEALVRLHDVHADVVKHLRGTSAHDLYNTHILDAIMQDYDSYSPALLPKCTAQNHLATQTEKHFCANMSSVVQNIFQAYKVKHKANAISLFKDALAKEREEWAKGNHVFYHGRQWEWDLVSDIYKNLYNLSNPGSTVDNDYTFIRFDNSSRRFGNALFLNVPLFGNSRNWGNSTAQLLLRGADWSHEKHKEFGAEKLCYSFKLEQAYKNHKAEFAQLERLHKKANPSNIGSLLMVVVDDKNVNTIYPTNCYASTKNSVKLSNGESTTEMRKIITDLKTGTLPDGGDSLEYVLPLEKDYALDPKKGPRIYAMNACDPVKYKKYTDYRDRLFAHIKAEIASPNNSDRNNDGLLTTLLGPIN